MGVRVIEIGRTIETMSKEGSDTELWKQCNE